MLPPHFLFVRWNSSTYTAPQRDGKIESYSRAEHFRAEQTREERRKAGAKCAPGRTTTTWKELKKDKKTVIACMGSCGLFCPKDERSSIL